MKKISFFLLIAVFVFTLSAVAFATGVKVSLTSEPVYQGEDVIVKVNMDENPGSIASVITVEYDSEALTLKAVKDMGIMGENNHSDNLSDDKYFLSWFNPLSKEDFDETGTIAELTFTAGEDVPAGNYEVKIDVVEMYNTNLQAVDVESEESTAVEIKEWISATGVTLNKDSVTLGVGASETLIATVEPENVSDKTVIWSSSDTDVATVSDGVVTAKSAGTAEITVTTLDGNKEATCVVTVKELPLLKVLGAEEKAGNIVDVAIEVKNNPGIALVSFKVDYNSDVMTLEAIEQGDIFSGEIDCNISTVPFVFNVYTGSDNKTEDGTLVTLRFRLSEECEEGEYEITLSDIESINIDEKDVVFGCINGSIIVKNFVPGDVTGDGEVTRSDLLRLAKHFSGFTVEIDKAASDVTGDGEVTRSDLLRLAKYFSGFSVELGK